MKKILIVEDDLKTQKIYFDKLTLEGFEVICTPSASEGLTFAKEKRPDVILLDVMLQDKMNGFDVLEFMKKDSDLSKIPVLVMTNLGGQENVAKEIGAFDYIVKANSSIEEVVAKIKTALGLS